MAKLTKAQQRVLDEMIEKGEFTCINTYKPALALIEAGLAVNTHQEKWGTIRLLPTPDAS